MTCRAEGNQRIISGHAAVFNQTVTVYGSQEEIAPGAFLESIASEDIVALWAHDTSKPLARKSAGTLALREDSAGLFFEASLGNQSWANDAHESVTRRDVKGASIGFIPLTEERIKRDGKDVYIVRKARLLEVSPVTFPAYPTTDVSARSLDGIPMSDLMDAFARLSLGRASKQDRQMIRQASALAGLTAAERSHIDELRARLLARRSI